MFDWFAPELSELGQPFAEWLLVGDKRTSRVDVHFDDPMSAIESMTTDMQSKVSRNIKSRKESHSNLPFNSHLIDSSKIN
jgi:hypothetical protein